MVAKMMDVQVPDEFICPISLQIMDYPVVTKNGTTYEREAILDWLARGSNTCPTTRLPLTLSDIIPYVQLEFRIRRWKIENGYMDITPVYCCRAESTKHSFMLSMEKMVTLKRQEEAEAEAEIQISCPVTTTTTTARKSIIKRFSLRRR
jgi:hypothetical protein